MPKYGATRAGAAESKHSPYLNSNMIDRILIAGMQVQFFVNQSEYLSSTTQAGMYLVLHDQDRPISLSNMGSEIPTGQLAAMSLRRVRSQA